MKAVWELICRFFTKDRIAKVWKILFNGAVTVAVSVLTNQALMDAAFEISLSILGIKDPTAAGIDKAAIFDRALAAWCQQHGRPIPSRAEMNVIREIAYSAVRSQEEMISRGLQCGNY